MRGKCVVVISLILFLTLSLCVPDTVKAADYSIDNKNRIITVKISDGANATDKVRSAMAKAAELAKKSKKGYKVRVPEGTYSLDMAIHLYSNVTLDATGCTFNYTRNKGNLVMSGDFADNASKKAGGYGFEKNMKVIGGTWNGNKDSESSLFRFCHASNITLDGCVLNGGNSPHQLEVCAINGFKVKNCTFKNMHKKAKDGRYEAIQFDVPVNAKVFNGAYADGTPMKNVEVTGCTFSKVPRGIGSHTMLIGAYHDNIKITNNTFKNIEQECIVALCYTNCKITGNTIKKCGAGILVQFYKPGNAATYTTVFDGTLSYYGTVKYNAATEISDNKIEIVSKKVADENVAIKVYGRDQKSTEKGYGDAEGQVLPANDYYISGVTVKNNTITAKGRGIHFFDVRSSQISGNTISCTGKKSDDAINVDYASKSIDITGNTIKKVKGSAICLKAKSTAGKISNNRINRAGQYGIMLGSDCYAKAIKGNKINNTSNFAVVVFGGSKCIIYNNSLSKYYYGKYAIFKKTGERKLAGNTGKVGKIKAKAKKKKVKLTWKHVKSASGYVVTYSHHKNFKDAKTVRIRNSKKDEDESNTEGNSTAQKPGGSKEISVKIDKLKSKKTYYFKVYAYRNVGDTIIKGKSSKVIKVKVK